MERVVCPVCDRALPCVPCGMCWLCACPAVASGLCGSWLRDSCTSIYIPRTHTTCQEPAVLI